jgi:lipoyl(octanoyl) transferase
VGNNEVLIKGPEIRVFEGLQDYETTLAKMRAFTETRVDATADELWFLEHPRVFTQGQAGKAEHLLSPGAIPVIASNRGGQVTYHGPGQIVVYMLMNLHRAGYGIRTLVTHIENALIATLAAYGISAYADPDARGVYVDIDGVRHKIASLGLRVSRGCSYHGLALNTAMDLEPFGRINPCGYQGLQVTQVSALGGPPIALVRADLTQNLLRTLGYTSGYTATT